MSTSQAIPQPEISPSSPAESLVELERKYLLQNYARFPVVFHRGKGCYLYDLDGKRYLDLISGIGVNALGHSHPRIIRIIREQAAMMIHCSNLYYHEYQGPLAGKLCQMSGLDRAFFCNSGAEAMEGALKMVRSHGSHIHPDKHEVISLDNSFHGRTMGAISITGQAKYRQDFEPLLSGVRFVPSCVPEALEEAVSDRTAGIVIETIQGEGGVYGLPAPFLQKARQLADRHNALLVADEIQCGLGRTGAYFAYQQLHPPVQPDIAVVAKPLAAGLPLGAILANEKAAQSIGPGMHGTTFGGGPLACRVALEFLKILDEIQPQMQQTATQFRLGFEELARHYRYIKEVRCYGLMLGIELKIPGKQLVQDALQQGLLMNCTHDNVLRFLPPFIISAPEVASALRILDKVFRKGREYYLESGLADA